MNGHYVRLLAMTALSFISMYIFMYAMVDRFANVYPNLNQFYMAGLMTTPMVLIELLLMGADVPQQDPEYRYCCSERVGAGSFLSSHQAANGNLRSVIPEIHDPTPCRSDPDV